MLPIHHACQGGHLSIVKLLFEQEPYCLLREEYSSCLHLAAENGDQELLEWLLHYDPDLEGSQGDFPWERALAHENYDAAVFLLSKNIEEIFYEYQDDGFPYDSLFECDFSVTAQLLPVLKPYLRDYYDPEDMQCSLLLSAAIENGDPKSFDLAINLFPTDLPDVLSPFSESETEEAPFLDIPVHQIMETWASIDSDCITFSHALECNNHHAINFLWNYPCYTAEDWANFSNLPFYNSMYHTPEVTAFLLCESSPRILLSRMRHLIWVHCGSSNTEGLEMLFDGDLRTAIVRLLGQFPESMTPKLKFLEDVRAKQREHIYQCCIQFLAKTPQSEKVLLYLQGKFPSEDLTARVFMTPMGDVHPIIEKALNLGSLEFVEFVFNKMADKDLRREFSAKRKLFKRPPNLLPILNGHIDTIRYFLKRIPPQIVVDEGTPLLEAILSDKQEIVRLLLQHYPENQLEPRNSCSSIRSPDFLWPLSEACKVKFDESVLKLMIDGFGVDSQIGVLVDEEAHLDSWLQPNHPIFEIVSLGNLKLLQHLVARGGNNQLKLCRSRTNMTVLHTLASERETENMFRKMEFIQSRTNSEWAECASFILDVVPEIENLLDSQNRHALHHACAAGLATLVEYLVERPSSRAFLNQKDNQGNYPLDLCTEHPEVTKVIIYKIDPAILCEHNMTDATPLHAAVNTEDPEIVVYTMEHVSDRCFKIQMTQSQRDVLITARSKPQRLTPLELALENYSGKSEDLEVIVKLVEKGGIKQITRFGDPFTVACQKSIAPAVDFFLTVLPSCPLDLSSLSRILSRQPAEEKTMRPPSATPLLSKREQLLLVLLQRGAIPEEYLQRVADKQTIARIEAAFMAQRKKSAKSAQE